MVSKKPFSSGFVAKKRKFCGEIRGKSGENLFFRISLQSLPSKAAEMEMPKYFFKKQYLTKSVAFIVLFSVIYMNVYQPYSKTAWFGLHPSRTLWITLLFYALSAGTLILSKTIMYHWQKRSSFTVREALVWFAAEFVVIAIEYIAMTDIFHMRQQTVTPQLVMNTSLSVALILAIPYTIMVLWADNREKSEELEAMYLSRRVQNEKTNSLVYLFDNNHSLKLSIDEKDILYIESQDNYVQIHYLLDGTPRHYLLRCRTYDVERQLAGTSLVRCHRSYLVNIRHIHQFTGEHGKTYVIVKEHDSLFRIPVSKTYQKSLTSQMIK